MEGARSAIALAMSGLATRRLEPARLPDHKNKERVWLPSDGKFGLAFHLDPGHAFRMPKLGEAI